MAKSSFMNMAFFVPEDFKDAFFLVRKDSKVAAFDARSIGIDVSDLNDEDKLMLARYLFSLVGEEEKNWIPLYEAIGRMAEKVNLTTEH